MIPVSDNVISKGIPPLTYPELLNNAPVVQLTAVDGPSNIAEITTQLLLLNPEG